MVLPLVVVLAVAVNFEVACVFHVTVALSGSGFPPQLEIPGAQYQGLVHVSHARPGSNHALLWPRTPGTYTRHRSSWQEGNASGHRVADVCGADRPGISLLETVGRDAERRNAHARRADYVESYRENFAITNT